MRALTPREIVPIVINFRINFGVTDIQNWLWILDMNFAFFIK
jgi:hypothetical protein